MWVKKRKARSGKGDEGTRRISKGEQWAIEWREYLHVSGFRMRSTRCILTLSADVSIFILELRVGALTVSCSFNDMENFTSKVSYKAPGVFTVLSVVTNMFFPVKCKNRNFQEVAARPLGDFEKTTSKDRNMRYFPLCEGVFFLKNTFPLAVVLFYIHSCASCER